MGHVACGGTAGRTSGLPVITASGNSKQKPVCSPNGLLVPQTEAVVNLGHASPPYRGRVWGVGAKGCGDMHIHMLDPNGATCE